MASIHVPARSVVGDQVIDSVTLPNGQEAHAIVEKDSSGNVIADRPGYQTATTEITSATTTGVKEDVTIWHPATLAKNVLITEIGASIRVIQTAGTFGFELQYISAENATPGGTTITPQQMNRGSAASGLTVRQVVTGAPTTVGQIFQRAVFPLPAAATPLVSWDGFIIFRAQNPRLEDAIELRSGQAEGLRITHNVAAALTTAPIFTIWFKHIEA